MQGLLDFINSPEGRIGLLQFGAGMMQPTRSGSFGEALGLGIQSGIQGYSNALNMQDQRQQRELLKQVQQARLAELQRQQALQEQLQGVLAQGSQGDDLTQQLIALGPEGVEIAAKLKSMRGTPQLVTVAGPDGKPVQRWVMPGEATGVDVGGLYQKELDPQVRQANIDDEVSKLRATFPLRRQLAQESLPKAPTGYRFTADGNLEAIPGGPADIKAGEAGEAKLKRAEHAIRQANVVLDTIDSALQMVGPSTTGLAGSLLGRVPGTDAYDLRSLVDTVKANIGFDTLQKMREMSPTGGALGQVAVQELNMLQATIGNLDPNQSQAQVRANLQKARQHYENWKNAVAQAAGLGEAVPSSPAKQNNGWSIKRK